MHAESVIAPAVDILLVEDDAPTRWVLRRLLESEGYTIAEAADGREAVDLTRQCRPQCVFLDLVMPGLDGFAVARTLRQDPRTRGTHIHALTGRTDAASREQALRAGCETYLTKPVNVEQLLDVVHREVRPGGPSQRIPGPLPRPRAPGRSDTPVWMRGHPAGGDGHAAQAPPPHAPREGDAGDLCAPLEANGHPHPDLDNEGGNGGGEDGNAFLGIAVALCIEACLVVFVMLPLCGVAVPRWAEFLALWPTLILLARCGKAGHRGRASGRDLDAKGGHPGRQGK
jgi:two-component system cell cycle response regulator DivK